MVRDRLFIQKVLQFGYLMHENPFRFVSLRGKRVKRVSKPAIQNRKGLDLLPISYTVYECICWSLEHLFRRSKTRS